MEGTEAILKTLLTERIKMIIVYRVFQWGCGLEIGEEILISAALGESR